ncbi:hypothetical protein PAMA_008354 [Pampus argenteus]
MAESFKMSLLFAVVLLLCCRYSTTGTQEVGQHIWERCDTARALLTRGCPFDRLEDPRGSSVLLKHQKITFHLKEQRHQQQLHQHVTRVQPQTVLLHLRPVTKIVTKSPLKTLRYTSYSFGVFVDKTVMPYISTAEDMLREPCKRTKPWPCSPPFSYLHVLSLTASVSLFTELVDLWHLGFSGGGFGCPDAGRLLSASVVVLGVAMLLLWKLLTSIHDRREFARFQRELEQRRWNRMAAADLAGRVEQSNIYHSDASPTLSVTGQACIQL